jgi:hypothetical protein
MFILLFGVSLIYYLPRNELLSTSFSLDLAGDEIAADEEAVRKIRLQLEEASRLFEIAESHFNHAPPDFMKAEMAYSFAAGGVQAGLHVLLRRRRQAERRSGAGEFSARGKCAACLSAA